MPLDSGLEGGARGGSAGAQLHQGRRGCGRRGRGCGVGGARTWLLGSQVSLEWPPPFTVPLLPAHSVTCTGTLRPIHMALVPHLLNVILNIGKGYHRILFSISYSRSQGAKVQPEGGKFETRRGPRGKTPPLTGLKLKRLSGLPPHPAQGLLCDSGPRGDVATIWGSPQPLSSRSLDLPSFTQRYLGLTDLQGVRTPYAAL